MLKKITNTNIEEMGMDLIERIKTRHDPFQKPRLVFSDTKMKNWFKALWLKNNDSILMNIEMESLESFIRDITNIYSGNYIDVEKTKIMILKVVSEDEYKNNLPEEIKNYINDDIRLYDFSSTLANLFKTYEKECFCFSSVKEEMKWQVELYHEVMKRLGELGYKSLVNFDGNYKNIKDPIYIFAPLNLSKLYLNILEDYSNNNDVYLYQYDESKDIVNKPKIKLMSAPSKIREIEACHSEICKKMMEDNNAKFSDFLVIAPNVSEYETSISRIFNGDGVDFPNIPFVVNGKKKNESFITSALQTLINILEKGYYSRKDFADLVNNKSIQYVKKIDSDKVDTYLKSILKMNVYRKEDWDYAKKRILLSLLVGDSSSFDNIIVINDKEYVPYSSIDLDYEVMDSCINIIDDIDEWINVMNKYKVVNKEFLITLKMELGKWFSVSSEDNIIEFNYLYKGVASLIDTWNDMIDDDNIPVKCLYLSLINASINTIFGRGSIYCDGVSFVNYNENSLYSSKYIFLLGMSSNNFPRMESRSEFDLRDNNETITDKDNKTFKAIINNASDSIYFSYVNKDLKKDEDFFLSSSVNDYLVSRGIDVKKDEIKIDIDETRNYSELFTKREFKNKNYYQGLIKKPQNDEEEIKLDKEESFSASDVEVKKLKLTNLRDFLKEPLMQKAKLVFGKDYDSGNANKVSCEFEPIDFEDYGKVNLFKELAIENYKCDEETKQKNSDEIKKKYLLLHKINNNIVAFNEFNKTVDDVNDFINKTRGVLGDNFEYLKLPNMQYHIKINDVDIKWELEANIDAFFSIEENNIKYCQIKKSNEDEVALYVLSLMHISSLTNDEKYNVSFSSNIEFSISPKEAKTIINEIYKEYVDFNDLIAFPVSLFEKKNNIDKKTFKQILDLVRDGFGHGAWSSFDDKALFDLHNDLGFDYTNYQEVLKEKLSKKRKLFKYIKDEGVDDGKI
ncbi:MAG: exodeoxyribonuclease V subunit gamma [Bacilli bacterium]|nr:exodeoxyribonuclease V subunit gamma [Bacilli bacterium]